MVAPKLQPTCPTSRTAFGPAIDCPGIDTERDCAGRPYPCVCGYWHIVYGAESMDRLTDGRITKEPGEVLMSNERDTMEESITRRLEAAHLGGGLKSVLEEAARIKDEIRIQTLKPQDKRGGCPARADDVESISRMSMERLLLERENALQDWWANLLDAEIS